MYVAKPRRQRVRHRERVDRAEPIAEPGVTAVGAALLAASARGWGPDPATALGEDG